MIYQSIFVYPFFPSDSLNRRLCFTAFQFERKIATQHTLETHSRRFFVVVLGTIRVCSFHSNTTFLFCCRTIFNYSLLNNYSLPDNFFKTKENEFFSSLCVNAFDVLSRIFYSWEGVWERKRATGQSEKYLLLFSNVIWCNIKFFGCLFPWAAVCFLLCWFTVCCYCCFSVIIMTLRVYVSFVLLRGEIVERSKIESH